MIEITINKKPYKIKSISELTFAEFNKIFVLAKVTDIREYLSVMTDISIEDLMSSVMTGATLETLYTLIFNVDIEATIKQEKATIKQGGKIHLMTDLSLETFGKAYYHDLYLQKYNAKVLNEYEIFIYSLAIALVENLDNGIEGTYNELAAMRWTDVLPQGFFLAKRYRRRSMTLTQHWKACILTMRKTNLKIRLQKHRFLSMARS